MTLNLLTLDDGGYAPPPPVLPANPPANLPPVPPAFSGTTTALAETGAASVLPLLLIGITVLLLGVALIYLGSRKLLAHH